MKSMGSRRIEQECGVTREKMPSFPRTIIQIGKPIRAISGESEGATFFADIFENGLLAPKVPPATFSRDPPPRPRADARSDALPGQYCSILKGFPRLDSGMKRNGSWTLYSFPQFFLLSFFPPRRDERAMGQCFHSIFSVLAPGFFAGFQDWNGMEYYFFQTDPAETRGSSASHALLYCVN